MTGDILQNHRTGADDCSSPDSHLGRDDGADADPRSLPHFHAAGEVDPGAKMNRIFDHAVVVNACAGVDNDMPAKDCRRVDHDSGHHDGPFTKGHIRRNCGPWMDGGGKAKASFLGAATKPHLGIAVTEPKQKMLDSLRPNPVKTFRPTENGFAKEFGSRIIAGHVLDKTSKRERVFGNNNIRDHFCMAARAPNNDVAFVHVY